MRHPLDAMKFAPNRPFSDPESAARSNSVESVRDGRIHIEKVNGHSCSDF
jgi:hypothetical protein